MKFCHSPVISPIFLIYIYIEKTYQFEHWASRLARIPIKPAAQKGINSLSSPFPQFRCPHPPQDSEIPRSLRGY